MHSFNLTVLEVRSLKAKSEWRMVIHAFIPTVGTQWGLGRTDPVPALRAQTAIGHLLLKGKDLQFGFGHFKFEVRGG